MHTCIVYIIYRSPKQTQMFCYKKAKNAKKKKVLNFDVTIKVHSFNSIDFNLINENKKMKNRSRQAYKFQLSPNNCQSNKQSLQKWQNLMIVTRCEPNEGFLFFFISLFTLHSIRFVCKDNRNLFKFCFFLSYREWALFFRHFFRTFRSFTVARIISCEWFLVFAPSFSLSSPVFSIVCCFFAHIYSPQYM